MSKFQIQLHGLVYPSDLYLPLPQQIETCVCAADRAGAEAQAKAVIQTALSLYQEANPEEESPEHYDYSIQEVETLIAIAELHFDYLDEPGDNGGRIECCPIFLTVPTPLTDQTIHNELMIQINKIFYAPGFEPVRFEVKQYRVM